MREICTSPRHISTLPIFDLANRQIIKVMRVRFFGRI
jgi:hypothetical protein